jgi:3-hydroxybutyrate dehydrogenase
MPDLATQTVLVTGAAQGLGAAIARHMAGQGARLVLMDVDPSGLDATAAACGDVIAIPVDLADAAATAEAARHLPPVDTLIHNAAILRPEPLRDVTLATFQATMNVGIQAAFQLTQAVWPHMAAAGGALIYVSSRSGIEGFAEETAYCAAKHALEGFSKCAALEGAPHGILSVTVTPGMYMHTLMSERTYPPDLRACWIDPIRLAPAFARLAADRPLALSGQRLDAWALTQETAA